MQGILVRLRTGLFKEAHARQTQRSVWMWLANEGAGWILRFTFYMLQVTHPTLPTSQGVTLWTWRYLLHVTPAILHISERGGRLPHVTLHPTKPTNCPINTFQLLLPQENPILCDKWALWYIHLQISLSHQHFLQFEIWNFEIGNFWHPKWVYITINPPYEPLWVGTPQFC